MSSARSTIREWPAVVGAAMAYAAPRTSVPLQAPRVLPRAGLVPNSAQVRANTSQYSVALYHCASALPVEHPGIGVGACGTMASYYGYFEGHAYPGAVAALGALRLPAPTCPHKSRVPLAAGVVATLYSGPLPEGNCGAAWHEAHWSFVLTGDLNGGTHGDATVPLAPSGERGRLLPPWPFPARGPRLHGFRHRRRGPVHVTDSKMFPGQWAIPRLRLRDLLQQGI